MFIVFPYAIQRRLRSVPWATVTIIALNVAVFLVTAPAFDRWARVLGFVAGPRGFVTWLPSLFLHTGWLHLIPNMYFLWLFGSFVEDVIGRGRFVALYLAGGLAGCLAHSAVMSFAQPSVAAIPVVGASGALAAIMGLFVVRFHRTRLEFWYVWCILFRFGAGTSSVTSLVGIALWALREVALGVLAVAGVTTGVATWAHVGAFVFGVGAALVLGLRGDAAAELITEEAQRYAAVGLGGIAAERYERLHARDPRDPQPLIDLARAHAASDPPAPERAGEALGRAIDVLAKGERRGEAVLLYEELLPRIGSSHVPSRTLATLGSIAEAMHGYGEALDIYGDLLRNHPDSAEAEKARFRLPHVYLAMGDHGRAQEEWRAFQRLHPSSRWTAYADTSLLTL